MTLEEKNEILKTTIKNLTYTLDTTQSELERAKKLLKDMESIKDSWNEEIEKIKEQRVEYTVLIENLKNMKNIT